MTDTDKLKLLAEAAHPHWYDVDISLKGDLIHAGAVGSYIASFRPVAILALIAERDEAVALLRELFVYQNNGIYDARISDFLARIDAAE